MPQFLPDAPVTNLEVGKVYEYGYYDTNKMWIRLGYITANGATVPRLTRSDKPPEMRVDINNSYNYGVYERGIWKSYEMYSYNKTNGIWTNSGTVAPDSSDGKSWNNFNRDFNRDFNGNDIMMNGTNMGVANADVLSDSTYSLSHPDGAMNFGNETLSQIMTYLPYIPKLIGYINPNGDSKIVVPGVPTQTNPVAQYYTNPPTIGDSGDASQDHSNNSNGIGNGSGIALNLFSNNNSASSNASSSTENESQNINVGNAGNRSESVNNGNIGNHGDIGNNSESVNNGNIGNHVEGGNNGEGSNEEDRLSPPQGINTRVNRGDNSRRSEQGQGSAEPPSNLNYYNAIPAKSGNYLPLTTDFSAFTK
jgi:hypothetical protein